METKKAWELGFRGRDTYVYRLCSDCGEGGWVRLVKSKPSSSKCHYCSVRSTEYRQKMSEQIKRSLSYG